MTASPLLDVRGLHRSFGGLHALRDVSFGVRAGTIKAIIGPNGAGKTTLLNLVSRLDAPTGGEIWYDSRRIDTLAAHRVVALGLARTFQNLRLFGEMSVLENVMVGRHPRTRAGMLGAIFQTASARREERGIVDRAWRLLDDVGLADQAHADAASLPFGRQRLLEIARALATEPRLLLLDEPAAGLNGDEAADLGHLIRGIGARGVTTVLVEHHMDLVMEISDEILVLNFGEALAEGRPDAVRNDPRVIDAYLGDEDALAEHLRA